jgi:hypothetical protein
MSSRQSANTNNLTLTSYIAGVEAALGHPLSDAEYGRYARQFADRAPAAAAAAAIPVAAPAAPASQARPAPQARGNGGTTPKRGSRTPRRGGTTPKRGSQVPTQVAYVLAAPQQGGGRGSNRRGAHVPAAAVVLAAPQPGSGRNSAKRSNSAKRAAAALFGQGSDGFKAVQKTEDTLLSLGSLKLDPTVTEEQKMQAAEDIAKAAQLIDSAKSKLNPARASSAKKERKPRAAQVPDATDASVAPQNGSNLNGGFRQ